jgi:tetratricopeptide (TPR) repeat protein
MNMKLKSNSVVLCCLLVAFGASVVTAQSDAIYRIKKSGKVSKQPGKIKEITPLSVTFDGRAGTEEIPVWEIEKLAAGNEPSEVERARDRIEDGRYDEAIELLEKVKVGDNPITDAEVAFNLALASANIAFNGGSVTATDAAGEMTKFLKANPKSHHSIPATELMGRLAMAAGKLEFASKQFSNLTKSKWPEYVARGHFNAGEVLMRQEKFTLAVNAYDKAIDLEANDDMTRRLKLLAQCQKAKAQAMTGDSVESIKQLESIIKQENPDDKELFAYAYNALGACYLKANDPVEAQEKFLFTHLLFDTETGPHAEAVYQLANIWSKQQRTDRASEARQILKTKYRNTWWASKL